MELENLLKKISRYTGIELNQLNLDRPFMELGFDSVTVVQFIGEIESELNVKLDMAALIDYPTINKLNFYLNNINNTSDKSDCVELEHANSRVAIVGMACKFPDAESPRKFYENLCEKKVSIRSFPEERIDLCYTGKLDLRESIYDGGYIDAIDKFDNVYFNISPNEALKMDPQQRLLMQEIVHALEDANLNKKDIDEKKIGLFVGATNADYFNSILPNKKDIESIIGNSMAMLSNRMSYIFDFKGPSVTLDTACSSSLVAVAEACNSLKNGYCDIAIAAGVNVILNPDINTALFEAGMLSKDGACHTFEDTANGYVRGEGVGVVVLKKQEDAEEIGNRIYASILGTNVNQDGRSASVTAPNKVMQKELLNRACNSAKLSPSNIRYVETHGTGTLLGDYIEVSAINETLNKEPNRKQKLLLGAVKKNIGHLEGAAGIASLIKVALCLYNNNIAPTIKVSEYNPKLELNEKNIGIVEDNLAISDLSFPCAISSFGFGGTNSCLIVDRYENETGATNIEKSAYIVPVSDINEKALHRNLNVLKQFIEESNISMADLEYAITSKCDRGMCRDAYVAESTEELVEKISHSLNKSYGKPAVRTRKKIGLLFSGQGSQWAQMANGLNEFEAYNKMFERCVQKFEEIGHCNVREVLEDIERGMLTDTYYAQPAIFTVEVSLAKLLENLGIKYDFVCGHSFGEISAAYVSGAISLDSAVRIIYTRSDILRRFEGKGKMLSVNIFEQEASRYIEEYKELSIGVINSEKSVVFSGYNQEIADVEHKLLAAGFKCKTLPVNCSFHFKGLEKYRDEFIERVGKVRTKPISNKFISTVVGGEYFSKKLNENYWADNMCQPVRFDKASKVLATEADIVLEVAPASVLIIYMMLNKFDTTLIPMQKRGYNPTKALLEGVAQLYSEGVEIDWAKIVSSKGNNWDFPNYEFAQNSFWPKKELIKQRYNSDTKFEIGIGQDLEKDFDKASGEGHTVLKEADVINKLLGIIREEVCVDDEINEDTDIYELGIDSLKCFQLNANINKSFNCHISFKDFLECRNLKELSSLVMGSVNNTLEERDEVSEEEFGGLVTPGQKAIILDQFLNPKSNKYNMGAAWKMENSIDKELWKSACEEVINKYLVLRLVFEIDKSKKIVQRKNSNSFIVNEIACDSFEQTENCLNEAVNEPFDLSKEVARCTIVTEGKKWYFAIVIHHAVIDGVSIFRVFEEIILRYKKKVEGRSDDIEIDTEYLKYQINENKIISGTQYIDSCEELRKKFSSYSLVQDYPVKLNHDEKIVSRVSEKFVSIEATKFDEIKKVCNENRFSVFELMYGLYQILYYKISNSNNFITCTYSSGREDTKYFSTVGYLVKNLLTACHVNPSEKLSVYIKNLHSEIMAAMDYPAGTSLKVLEDKINEERADLGHVFVYEKATGEVKGAPIFINGGSEDSKVYVEGIGFEKIETQPIDAQYNIVFMMEECEDQLVLKCQYKNSVYSDEEVDVIMNSYYSLVANVISNPNSRIMDYELINLLEADDELTGLEFEKNDHKQMMYHQYLEKYAELTPNAIAATYKNTQITYRRLNYLSNYLANKIIEITDGKEQPIGIAVEKSLKFLVGIFAVMKSGAFYVPLDKNYPKERLDYIISDSKMNLIISDGTFDSMNLDWNNIEKMLYPEISIDCEKIIIDGECIDELSIKNLNRCIDVKNGAYAIYTSGTTGVPKGVKVTHSGISDVVNEQEKLFKVSNTDKVSFFASVCFDASVFDILMAIGHGAELSFDTRENMGTGIRLHRFLKERKISVTTLPSSVLASMENIELDSLRVIVTAGEPCTAEVKNTWCKGHDFFNAYGVTEATIWNTTSKCTEDKPVLIGKAVSGNKLLVVNNDNNICPQGCAGELLIGGRVIAAGYIGLEEENNKKFITIRGERFYKSGDIVRRTVSGELEYVGRVDNQIKIHGFRIEIEEIEKVIQNQPGVKNAIVVANDIGSDKRLVCFIEAQRDIPFEIRSFKKGIIDILPHYMIPEQFIQVESMDLTNNGKIDRKKLMLKAKEVSKNRAIVKPANKIEQEVVELLKKYVDADISIEDSLLELGINSINIYNLIVDIEEGYGVSVGIGDLLSGISVKELADLILQEDNSSLITKTLTEKREIALMKKPTNIPIVLSTKQQGIWTACAINPKTREFNIPVVVKMTGMLDYGRFCKAFSQIICKHEVLRTRFIECNETIIGFVEELNEQTIPLVDISNLGENEKSVYISKEIKNMQYADLHPKDYPLYKVELLKSGETKHYLLLTIHHFIADGWSFSVIFDELKKNYNALRNNEVLHDMLEYQYSDVAYSEAVNYSYIDNETTQKYWEDKLKNDCLVLNLPEDYQRPNVMTHVGRNTFGEIDRENYIGLTEFAKRNNVTKFSLLTAVLGIVLRKYSGQQNVPIGFPVLGREDKYSQQMVGMFIDTTVAKLSVNDDDSFEKYLVGVNREILEAMDYGKIGLGRIMEIVNPPRTTNNTALFQVLINMIDFNVDMNGFDGMSVEPVMDSEQEAKYDFTLYIQDDGEKLKLRLNYYSDVYSEETAKRLLSNFIELISQVVKDSEKTIGEFKFERTKSNLKLDYQRNESLEKLVDSDFKAIYKGDTFSADYFEDKKNEILRTLQNEGVVEGVNIGLSGCRKPDIIAAILAIMSLGARFVVIDKEWPKQRQADALNVARCSFYLDISKDIKLEKISGMDCVMDIADCSYISLTSGTTGKPKCILGHNSAINHFITWEKKKFKLDKKDIFAVLSGISHDPFLRDIFVPLSVGATLVFPPEEAIIKNNLFDYLHENKISVVNMTPSLADAIVLQAQSNKTKKLYDLRLVFLGGERLKKLTFKAIKTLAPNCRIVNYYGTTETPQGMSYIEYDEAQIDTYGEYLPIGKGIADVQVIVADNKNDEAAIGEVGTILIRTKYLAKGYLSEVDNKVAPLTLDGVTYNTGDVGRYRGDGTIEILGRRDDQIKILGHRIELGEIESAISNYPEIRNAKAIVFNDMIYAFVIAETEFNENECIYELHQKLPNYMIPAHIIKIDNIPLTTNGKTDIRELKKIINEIQDSSNEVIDGTETEKQVYKIWQDVLGRGNIPMDKTFFDVGGTSMSLLVLQKKLQLSLKKDVKVTDLFEYTTIRDFSGFIEASADLAKNENEWDKSKARSANVIKALKMTAKNKRETN